MSTDLFKLMFGSLANGIITISLFIVIAVILIKIRRIQRFMTILVVILVYGIYSELVSPYLIEYLCGDPTMTLIYQINALQVYNMNQYLGYLLFNDTIKPLAGMESVLHFTFILLGMAIFGTLIIRSARKLFTKQDTPPVPKEKK